MSAQPFFDLDSMTETSFAWSIAAAELFLYGAYLLMFGFYLHVLRIHGIVQHRFLAASTISLFVLGTAHCALQLATTIFEIRRMVPVFLGQEDSSFDPSPSFEEINHNENVYNSLTEAASGIYVTSNVIADSIFIFRCYGIWGCRRKIVILPIILTLAVAGLGYSNIQINFETKFSGGGINLFISSVATSIFTTFVLMGLTVGRIWWLARAARHVMGKKGANKYYTVYAMILESGALYCIGGIAFLAVGLTKGGDLLYSGGVLAQLVGIAPTIIAVRVGLGYSVENLDSFIAPVPRTRPLPRVIPATSSMEDQVLYIHAYGVKGEGV